jgi:hypothetical protein
MNGRTPERPNGRTGQFQHETVLKRIEAVSKRTPERMNERTGERPNGRTELVV